MRWMSFDLPSPLGWMMVCAMASVVSAMMAHHFSRSHYLLLGIDRGSIDARAAVMQQIDAALPGLAACSESDYKNWKEIVSVKSGAVYVKQTIDTSVSICRAH
jgi:activator of 2-hydroxyglutaryl-CoA dehydratase